MFRGSHERIIAACFACVLVVSLVFPAGATPVSTAGDAPDSSVTVAVDCQERVVRVSAPTSTQYSIRVAVVNVTPTGTTTAQTSRGPLRGNATVAFDETGLVHAFVTNSSTGHVVTSAVTDCYEATVVTETTTVPGVESVVIDCNESVVRVEASPDVRYDVRITVVRVSPTSQTVSSVTRGPNTGNATVQFSGIGNATQSVDANATVYAFVSTDTGRDAVVMTVMQCPETNATALRTHR